MNIRNEHHRAIFIIIGTNGLAAPLVTTYEYLTSPFETFMAFAQRGIVIMLVLMFLQSVLHDFFIGWLLKPAREFLTSEPDMRDSRKARHAIESLIRFPPLSAAGSII